MSSVALGGQREYRSGNLCFLVTSIEECQ